MGLAVAAFNVLARLPLLVRPCSRAVGVCVWVPRRLVTDSAFQNTVWRTMFFTPYRDSQGYSMPGQAKERPPALLSCLGMFQA